MTHETSSLQPDFNHHWYVQWFRSDPTLTLYTKEGMESLCILLYTIGGQAVNG